MNVKVEKTKNNNEVKLEITVEAEKFDNAIKSVFNKNAKYFNIPGFRKGKAPFHIVEKTYGSQIFYEDAFNEVAGSAYEEALKEKEIDAVSRPEIDLVQIEKGKDLIFTAVVATKPEVTLGKYKGIQIKKIEYNVSDEDIEHELGHMAEKNARLVSVEDRPVESGDITVIDFEGFVDGVAFDGGKAENHELTIGSNTFIPGFEDQIIGMKLEEEREINVKFPEEYFSANLAGKDAMFKVKLHEIKKKELPVIDDEFAKDVSEYETLERKVIDVEAKGMSYNTEPLFDNEKRFFVRQAMFDRDAVVVKNFKSENVALKSLNHNKSIVFHMSGFEHLGIWASKHVGGLIAIEPWVGHNDYVGFAGEFKEKEGVRTISPNETFECEFIVDINQ